MDPVKFRDCACPGNPHPNGDTVTYRERLPFDANVAALSAIVGGEGDPRANKAWSVYLHAGPLAWNLVDEEGNAVPLSDETLDALPFEDQFEIGDHADDIYGTVVLAPLVRRMRNSSKAGPTKPGSRRRTARS
jgi:hypothetical protein